VVWHFVNNIEEMGNVSSSYSALPTKDDGENFAAQAFVDLK
jgi:hypothetical protein